MEINPKLLLIDKRCSVTGELVEKNGKIYNCALNQTDLTVNSNKFYIIQLIKGQSGYHLFTSYGRTGEKGKSNIENYSSEISGISAFEKQFKTKTGNDWHTKSFVKKQKKYYMSEIDYDAELKALKGDKAEVDVNKAEIVVPQSKLDAKVQNLISMFSDVNMMQESLLSLDIDPQKMPLGKLSNTQLVKAEEVLNKIETLLQTSNNESDLTDLSSEYYTYLPMSFGRRTPPIIKTSEMLANYRNVIEELKNIVVNIKIRESAKVGNNILDSIYDDIGTTIKVLNAEDQIYNEIVKYVNNTQGATHHYNLKVLDIFEVEQKGKKDKFDQTCATIKERMLLYHGSAIANWLSILKHDLLINPAAVKNNVVVTGKMFGNGIYFANCISKSYGYCRADSSKGVACLALAEVAIGKTYKLPHSEHVTPELLKHKGFDSTHGIGRYAPSMSTEVNQISIPNGQLSDTTTNTSLLYDEFIVYKSEQQLIKYLVLVANK